MPAQQKNKPSLQCFMKKNFLKWQPCHFLFLVFCFVYVNVLSFLLFFWKLACYPIPYFNLQICFIEDGLALALWYKGSVSLQYNLFLLILHSWSWDIWSPNSWQTDRHIFNTVYGWLCGFFLDEICILPSHFGLRGQNMLVF